jgi:hypothetical protein
MNDENKECVKEMNPIQSAIESIIKTQQDIAATIATGEAIMDNVVAREPPEEGKEPIKELHPGNMTEALQKIERDTRALYENAQHLIKRMRSNF